MLCLHQFLQYRILHDHPGGGQAEHLSVPHGVPVPDALPHKDALCRRKPSAAAFIRRDIQPAAVFQEDRLCPQLTAAANLTLTGYGLTPRDAERELRTLGFTDAELALPAARLSGGQKRRAALLRALLCRDAKTLLLDEPFTGMDAELVEDAVAATKRLAGERPTILVTHDRTAADLLGWPVREV